jgi:HPr kinase/phosphorylase
LGATLVSDDRVTASALPGGGLWLAPPDAIAGRIEARGVGLIALPYRSARAHSVVTLDGVETERLPHVQSISIAGVELPLLRKVESPAFPAMLSAYLKGERTDP